MTDRKLIPGLGIPFPKWMGKIDERPKKGFWAPGRYACKCCHCNDKFIGDKRAVVCADCAYGESEEKHE